MDIKDLIKKGRIEPYKTSETKGMENAPPLYKVNHSPKPCEDCGKVITDRNVVWRKHHIPHNHWRKRCSVCLMYFIPKTGKWDTTSNELAHYYRYYKSQSKKNR